MATGSLSRRLFRCIRRLLCRRFFLVLRWLLLLSVIEPPLRVWNPICIRILLKGRTINRKGTVDRLKYWGYASRRPASHIFRRALHYQILGKYKADRPYFYFTWHNSYDNVNSWMVLRHSSYCDFISLSGKSASITSTCWFGH